MTMISFDDVAREFSRLAFTMPGWTLELHRPTALGPAIAELRITAEFLDSRGSGNIIPVRVTALVYPGMPTTTLPGWVYRRINNLMQHETSEWFMKDGARIFDTHRPDTRTIVAHDPHEEGYFSNQTTTEYQVIVYSS